MIDVPGKGRQKSWVHGGATFTDADGGRLGLGRYAAVGVEYDGPGEHVAVARLQAFELVGFAKLPVIGVGDLRCASGAAAGVWLVGVNDVALRVSSSVAAKALGQEAVALQVSYEKAGLVRGPGEVHVERDAAIEPPFQVGLQRRETMGD